MEKQKILDERKQWYGYIFVKLEIVKLLKHRELCMLEDKSVPRELRKKNVHLCKCEAIDYLDKNLKWINFFDHLVNMYHSVATFDNLPMMSFNMEKRTKDPI
jgi:hypothetical protein